jgi:hypothetical protein
MNSNFLRASIAAFLLLSQGSAMAVSTSSDTPPVPYTRPLLFAPDDNGIHLLSPQLKWDIPARGTRIDLGGMAIDGEKIQVHATQIDRDSASGSYKSWRDGGAKLTILSFTWPENLVKTGTVQALSQNDEVLWTTEVNESSKAAWQKLLQRDNDKLLGAQADTSIGWTDVNPTEQIFLGKNSSWRLCLTQTLNTGEEIHLCSPFYRDDVSAENLVSIYPANAKAEKPTVIINGEDIGSRGLANFPGQDALSVEIHLLNNSLIAFKTRAAQLKLLDIVLSKDERQIILTGQGVKPVGAVKDLIVPPNHFWSASGLHEEVIWQMNVDRETPLVRVLGNWNIPLTYWLKFKSLPREDDRVYISERTGSGTYSHYTSIYGYTPEAEAIGSSESRAKKLNPNEFWWRFQANKKGERNWSRLKTRKNESAARTWIAHYQLYRGYPFEVSGRLTGIVSNNFQMIIAGEAAGSYWAETIFDWDNHYLSHQRWGFTGRYFRTASAIQVPTDNGALESLGTVSTMNEDLRYNLTPGIWNRDELYGLILSANQITLGTHKANLLGPGFYWARTMPKFLDDAFNYFSWLRYSKYLDIEFLYYNYSLSPSAQTNGTFNLNFHGKVFWTQQFYGEAGFGLKSFSFVDNSDASNPYDVGIALLYGTIGMGFVF